MSLQSVHLISQRYIEVWNHSRTLNNDVMAVPEAVAVIKERRVERRRRLVRLPVRPVLAKVCRVAELVRAVHERVGAATDGQRRVVVVRVGEHHQSLRRSRGHVTCRVAHISTHFSNIPEITIAYL